MMKKNCIIILFIFCIITIPSWGQSRLGYSFNAVLREFKKQNPKSDTILFQKRIVVKNVSNTCYYYFDKKDFCETTVIAVIDEEMANKYIKAYDSNFTKVGSNEWQVRSRFFKNADIFMSYSNLYGYLFTWKIVWKIKD
jgi:hypothetical protein